VIRLVALCVLALGCRPSTGHAQPKPPMTRDGQHDFDFEIGTWKTQLRRLERPLTGSTSWVDYTGTSTVRSLGDGRANVIELAVEGPAGRIEGLSLRLYDPRARQWSLSFSNLRTGTLAPPVYGAFEHGRGVFYGLDSLDGRMILVRFVISDITATSARFEQAVSADGGATGEVTWIATDTRL
jgi:hypothetical protein